MLTSSTINRLQLLLSALVILGSFGLIGAATPASAQSAEFQWAVTNDGIQVNAQEDGDAFLYNLQLYNQNEEIVSEQTNSTGDFFIENSDLTAGEVYDLNLSLLDEASGDIRATHFEPVAVPQLTISSQCNTIMQGEIIDITVDIVPDLDFFPGLNNPEVTIIENGNSLNSVSKLPHTYEVGQRNRTYRAEVTFSNATDPMLSTETIDTSIYNPYCKDDEEEEVEETTVNFGYEVNGHTVTATVLNPNSNYEYVWDVGGEAGPDYQGTTLSHTFTTDGSVSIELIASQGEEIPGRISHDFVVPANFQDSDGDDIPDSEEDEDDTPDDNGDDEEEDDEAEFTGTEEGLVNCTNNCGWAEFIALINRLVTWLIGFATVVATVLFMYAGFLYLTAGGDESQTDQAKGILTNVAVGFGIILIAWLMVVSVVTLLTTDKWRGDYQHLIPIDLSLEPDNDRLQL